MARTASVVTQIFAGFLTATDTGVSNAVATLALDSGTDLAPIPNEYIITQNMSFEIAERASVTKYPVVLVYSDRMRNLLTEKFRNFSGKIRTVAEVRMSQDRIEGLEDQVKLYVDAVTQILDANRGNWGQGAFYAGGYEATFEQVRHGGKNFLQVAKVTFEVDMSA